MSSDATDTTYIISPEREDESPTLNGTINSQLDTYLDERIDIPDRDNASRHSFILSEF